MLLSSVQHQSSYIVVEIFHRWFRNINRDLDGQGMVDGRYCCRKPSIINSPCASSSVEKIFKTAVLTFPHWSLLQIYTEWFRQTALKYPILDLTKDLLLKSNNIYLSLNATSAHNLYICIPFFFNFQNRLMSNWSYPETNN